MDNLSFIVIVVGNKAGCPHNYFQNKSGGAVHISTSKNVGTKLHFDAGHGKIQWEIHQNKHGTNMKPRAFCFLMANVSSIIVFGLKKQADKTHSIFSNGLTHVNTANGCVLLIVNRPNKCKMMEHKLYTPSKTQLHMRKDCASENMKHCSCTMCYCCNKTFLNPMHQTTTLTRKSWPLAWGKNNIRSSKKPRPSKPPAGTAKLELARPHGS